MKNNSLKEQVSIMNLNYTKFINYCEPFMEQGSLTPSFIGDTPKIVRLTSCAKLKPNASIADVAKFIQICEAIQRASAPLLFKVESIIKDKVSSLFRGKKHPDEYWHTKHCNFQRTSKDAKKSRNYFNIVSEIIQKRSKRYPLDGTETSAEIVYELLTLTDLSQIYYHYTVYQVKEQISRYFGCAGPDYFSSGVFTLAKYVRNYDFHNKASYRRIDCGMIQGYRNCSIRRGVILHLTSVHFMGV